MLGTRRATQRLVTLIPQSLRMKLKSSVLDVLGVTQLQNDVKAAKEEALAARMECRRVMGLMRLQEYDRAKGSPSGDRDS
jgi:hypothetical protein